MYVWMMEVRKRESFWDCIECISQLLISIILFQSFQSVDLIFPIVCLSSASIEALWSYLHLPIDTHMYKLHWERVKVRDSIKPILRLMHNLSQIIFSLLIILKQFSSDSNCVSLYIIDRSVYFCSNQSFITWCDAKKFSNASNSQSVNVCLFTLLIDHVSNNFAR